MITEDYVSFETAKLLKEKGFDEKCRTYYKVFPKDRIAAIYHSSENRGVSEDDPNEILCPTLQMAMKWLRVNGYQIIVKHTDDNGYFANILTMDNAHPVNKLFDGYNVYEQAAEAAVKYCLEKLI